MLSASIDRRSRLVVTSLLLVGIPLLGLLAVLQVGKDIPSPDLVYLRPASQPASAC